MRKVTAGLFHSIDGVVEAPNEWQFDQFDDELGVVFGRVLEATDTVILGRVGYEAWQKDFDEGPDAFVDTAALLASLDLVVSADTAVTHVAGAMGRPAWLALNPVPDWRWMLDRSDSPWYPSVRLFRQPRPGPWAPVFDAMAAALAPRLPTR